jgi:hypothetical protein
MRSIVQCTDAFELSASVTNHEPYGFNFQFISFIPSANRPEEHIRFQGQFSQKELIALRDFLDAAIKEVAC